MEASPAADPEAEFIASNQETGNEWEVFKENVRPLKRGRNIHLLNLALISGSNCLLRNSLHEERRKFIEAIDQYSGDDPLQPWLQCIKWVQESFPAGGNCSGLIMIYEECVRSLWTIERYKDDIRYLNVWLEYASNCADAEVIFKFLHANDIGQCHSAYYISYALILESQNKMKKADEIFNLGIARKAKPREILDEAYKKFIVRTARYKLSENEAEDSQLPHRTFGTILSAEASAAQVRGRLGVATKRGTLERSANNAHFTIFNDSDAHATARYPCDQRKNNVGSWHLLGTGVNRNKENISIPSKWTSVRIVQHAGPRVQPVVDRPCIEVFIDDECVEKPSQTASDNMEDCILKNRCTDDGLYLQKRSELLKENPLHNFPLHSLPR